MKDMKAINWRERFPQLPLDKNNKLKEGSWEVLGGGGEYLSCFFWKKRIMSV
jgi:hypothetical protein